MLKKLKYVPFVDFKEKTISPEYKSTFLEDNGFLMQYVGEEFSDNIIFERISNGYKVKRIFKNLSEKEQKLKGLSLQVLEINFNLNPKNDYFYCVENARNYGNYAIPIDFDRDNMQYNSQIDFNLDTKWTDPDVVSNKICASPYQPIPAMLISNFKSKKGIVIGTLNQDKFYNYYTLEHLGKDIKACVFSQFKDIEYRIIKSGEEMIDEWFIGSVNNADNFTEFFNDYINLLRAKIAPCKKLDNNRHSLIWDSWNDGIYRNVSESMLVEEAKAVKKYFPSAEWFQLDDGYATLCYDNVDSGAHGLGVIYEGEEGIDKKKFPNGLKSYTDKIKEIGLKPAIWIGGFCPSDSKIYKEKKDWFIDYSYRTKNAHPLDVSKKEVREYMCHAIDVFVNDYGFEGIKHDFWSYAFEDSHDLLTFKDKSGYEYREWWHSELRKRIPNGYLETGCDVSMGNPFIAKYFDNYRMGLDVGAGEWDRVKTSIFWACGYLATHSGDMFIPNFDSIGILPGLNDRDFFFLINFVFISRTMVELSGRFSKIDEDNYRLKVLQKASCCINNGEDVYFPTFNYREKGEINPNIIYIKSSIFSLDKDNPLISLRSVALFNAEEKEKIVMLNIKDLNLKGKNYKAMDVWSGEEYDLSKEKSFRLEPHQSILLSVYDDKKVAIKDANIKLSNIELKDNIIYAKSEYCEKGYLKVNKNIKAIVINGNKILNRNKDIINL